MFRMQQQNFGTSAERIQQFRNSTVFICIRIAIIPGLHFVGVSLCDIWTKNVFCDVMVHHLSSTSPIIDTVLLDFVKD